MDTESEPPGLVERQSRYTASTILKGYTVGMVLIDVVQLEVVDRMVCVSLW